MLAGIERLVLERRADFAVGAYGAIAEFEWVDGDRPVRASGPLAIATGRGALAIRPHPQASTLHWQARDAHGTRARRAITLCLPREISRLTVHRGVHELGPDDLAVRAADREALLFDLGLGLPHLQACVRTRDTALIEVLRAHACQSLLAPGSAALAAVKEASPHRVFCTRLARIEVFQPIPAPARGERTPSGPHTHLLPRLLATGHLHSPQLQVPAHVYPVLDVYPHGD